MSERFQGIDVDPGFWDGSSALLAAAGSCNGVAAPLIDALRASPSPPVPGNGRTRSLFGLLASFGALDLTAARVIEPHFDAAAIMAQSGSSIDPGTSWGVFASASPVEVRWEPESARDDSPPRRATLSGTKRWCSLASSLDRALVTASDHHGEWMFVLDLSQDAVSPHEGGAPLTGLSGVPSGPVELDAASAWTVGDGADWYTSRPGFAWGGIGVAAVWFGAAVALGRSLQSSASSREPDQLACAWLGEADRLLHGIRVQLEDAADRIDAGTADWGLAQRVRGNTASGCTRLLAICGEALGPAPLAFDPVHARRVADLTMYLRQHHGARDDAARGRSLSDAVRAEHDASPGGGAS
ncbi:acyl-CoA/acyl-ACP dehydrogenase [Pseudoclavibacter sp. RFBB5]|uniref:acyl-CoA/acyl-ACP dehydrogenase n=1 Tax=unclassified Pseudoclavibacter TaxID=2615177 RepID=UPI0015E23119|nr:acyl-CoA/acyl-ACP dehydrogenase [Pseudoclavibacter sp. RFBB5]